MKARILEKRSCETLDGISGAMAGLRCVSTYITGLSGADAWCRVGRVEGLDETGADRFPSYE